MDAPTTSLADDDLSSALSALSSPVRLAILRRLRTPRALNEIEIEAPGGRAAAEGRPRVLARQTVREHLDKLLEIGVIVTQKGHRSYGETPEYLLNHQRLYALSEAFRSLARLRPAQEPGGLTVVGDAAPAAPYEIQGPCLVLVKGLDEGRTFPLHPPGAGRAVWRIGRRRDLEVPLDFDPYISSENASVAWDGHAFNLEDLPASRNGTQLNFQALAKGEPRPLRTGDVVGVGKTLLLFRA